MNSAGQWAALAALTAALAEVSGASVADAGLVMSELNALLCLDALFLVGMLDGTHLADEVGQFDQCIGCMATGDDDMQHLAARRKDVQYFLQVEVLVFEDDVHFVQNHH